jgi:hypothetical protein
MRGLMGSFQVMPLREVLDLLARHRLTGTLTCERGAIRKACYLVDGVVVEASSNDPREYLGQLLVNFGHLSEEHLTAAFEAQQQSRARMGGVLVARGLVSPDAVRDTLAIKIRETLLDALLWDDGFFYVERMPPRPVDDLDARVELAEVVREAEFRSAAWQAFRAAFPGGATRLEVDEARVPPSLDPSSTNGRIVALARAGNTLDEIAIALHATEFHLYQRLYALWTQGVLRAALARPSAADAAAEVPQLLDDARAHLAGGRYEEAEVAAERAAAIDPSAAETAEMRERARTLLAAKLRAQVLEPPRTPVARVPRDAIAGLPIGAPDKWLLARCDGERDAAALVRLAPASELEVLKGLRRLALRKLVELREGAA